MNDKRSADNEGAAFLAANPDLDAVEFLICDTNGLLRGKWAPAGALEKAFSSCVPYLPTFCGDLEKTETAIDSTVLGLMHVSKHQQRHDIIMKVLRFQKQQLNYAKLKVKPGSQQLLHATMQPMEKKDEKAFADSMWEASLRVEPRDPPT